MKVWRKQTTRYELNGKRASKHTQNAKRVSVFSKRWYGTITLSTGKRKQIPLTEDEDTSQKLLKQRQQEQDDRLVNGTTQYDDAKQKPISEILDEFIAYLRSKENSAEYLRTTRQRLDKLVKGLNVKTIPDLDSTRILRLLADWRSRKEHPISVGTSNHYIVAAKNLSKWLQRERMTIDDMLISLRRMNSEKDRRRNRRALTADEFKRLIETTHRSKKSYLGNDWFFPASARVMLYRLAAFTGLRANELASLTKSSFDFVSKTFRIAAKNAKNGKTSILPLHPSLCECLPQWFDTLNKDQVFPGSWTRRRLAGQFLKRDLKRCGIACVDANGKQLDFHSLRYTFITNLAKAGVHPSKAQRLARHSSIILTLSVYTQYDADDLRDAVDSLPAS